LSFRRGFTGMELDRSTGLYYDKARYYDAGVGRFITPDSQLGASMLEFAAFNRYAYGANDPTYFTDPSGHNIFDALGRFFAPVIDWIGEHAAAFGSIALGAFEVVIGVAALSWNPVLGKALIGAGVGGLLYSSFHFNDFSWEGWGIAEGTGALFGIYAHYAGVKAAAGLLAAPTIGAGVSLIIPDGGGKANAEGGDAAAEGGQGETGQRGTGTESGPAGTGRRGPSGPMDGLPESAAHGGSVAGRAFDLGQLSMSPALGRL
ncbi:MAG: RHS repeat-associated core domain-containing protein, partial [Acidobacteriota bacterium]